LINFAGAGTDASPIDQATLVYDWDFGDGVTGSGQLVSHTYQQGGDYIITLTVTDKDGAAGVDTTTVQVRPANQPPRAIINGPENGVVGDILTFSGSDSNDGDGHIASYDWDFGDGTIASGVKATHAYSEAGSYQVILTVTDDGGLIDKATHAVQIEPPVPANLPPEAVITAPETAQVGQAVTFDASGSSDSDGHIVSYAWDFGDGAVADGVVVTHTYNEPGQYKIKLIVTDDGGLTGKVKHIIQVEPPVQADA
jgi:PKD repeat protein